MRIKDSYKEVRIFESPGITARVYIPDLTPQERTRRMNAIHIQSEKLLKEVIHNAQ